MKDKIRKVIVYGSLVIAVIWGANNLMPKNNVVVSKTDTAGPEVQREATNATASEKQAIDISEMKAKSWGEDPFRANANGSK